MEYVLKKNDLERAGRLGIVFGMNVQQLLESAADIFLMNNDCSRAMVLYKLSRVSHHFQILTIIVLDFSIFFTNFFAVSFIEESIKNCCCWSYRKVAGLVDALPHASHGQRINNSNENPSFESQCTRLYGAHT